MMRETVFNHVNYHIMNYQSPQKKIHSQPKTFITTPGKLPIQYPKGITRKPMQSFQWTSGVFPQHPLTPKTSLFSTPTKNPFKSHTNSSKKNDSCLNKIIQDNHDKHSEDTKLSYLNSSNKR